MEKNDRLQGIRDSINNLVSLIEQEEDDAHGLYANYEIKVLNIRNSIHIFKKEHLKEIAKAFDMVPRVFVRGEKEYETEIYIVVRGVKLFALV